MAQDIRNRLLITLAVRLHAFSVCQIQRGWRLRFGPLEAVTIHDVLAGSGSVRAGDGPWVPFSPHSMVIIPARQPHALGEAEAQIGAFVAHYNHQCWHESLSDYAWPMWED